MVPYRKENDEVAIHEAAIWMTPDFDKVLNESRMGYSDGTRGLDEIPMAIRPAAFGAATSRYKLENGQPFFFDIQCLGGEVPGAQTAPRAETWVAIVLLTGVHSNASPGLASTRRTSRWASATR